MKISIKKLVFGLMIVGILVPFAAQAQTPTTYTPLAPLPCIAGNGVDCTSAGGNGQLAKTVSFQTYVQYTFNLLIALAAVAAVFMMVYGGFLYMTSSAVTTKEDGLKKVYNAVGGLALVLCSYLILKTINPQFVQVPASLVTPLGLSAANTASSWATTLESEANNYDANIQNLQNSIQQSQNTISGLQQQINNDQAQMATACKNGDTATCNQLQADINSKQNQINTEKGNVVSNTGIQLMDQKALEAITSTSSNSGQLPQADQLTSNIAAINQISSTTDAQLIQSGQYQAVQAVNNQALYSKVLTGATIIINQLNTITSVSSLGFVHATNADGNTTNGQTANSIRSNIQDELNLEIANSKQITDPTLRAQSNAKIIAASSLLQSKLPTQ